MSSSANTTVSETESASVVNAPIVIEAKGISKCYHSYNKPIHRLRQSFQPKKKFYDEFWALRGVDLTVRKGEVVGIVGKNGSGKSTLLQIITGILKPNEGSVKTEGRISALLELGAGFNPDFTGMENARLNAAIMGLSREEFHKKLPDIVEFCGLGDFLNRPVKTYSSGMFVRLAFAVAINMDPDILIIDEALAVGDVRFQSRCFRRLNELKTQGVTILFVTHSTDSVIKFCDRAILLDEGQLKMTGSPKEVVQTYLEMMFGPDDANSATNASASENGNQGGMSADLVIKPIAVDIDFDPLKDNCVTHPSYNENEQRWGDQRATICHYQLFGNDQASNGMFTSGDALRVQTSVLFFQTIDNLIYGITIKTADGNIIYGTNTRITGNVSEAQDAGDLITLEFALTLNLLGGDYFLSLGVAQDHQEKDNVAIDRRYDLIHIHVEHKQADRAKKSAQLPAGFAQLDGTVTQIIQSDGGDNGGDAK